MLSLCGDDCGRVPDVDSESVIVDQRTLIGSLQGDGGLGSSAHFTAQDHRLPQSTRHVRQGRQELWRHCVTEPAHHSDHTALVIQ